MVAMLVVFFGVVAYFLLVEGLSRNTVNPWDMRMADMVDLPDGSARVTGFNTVTGKLGADESSVTLQVPVSRLIRSASENGTVEIKTLGGKPVLVDKELLAGPESPATGQMWAYVFVSRTDPLDRNLVIAAQSGRNLASTLGMFRQVMLISAGITLLVATVFGFLLVWRMLQPLQRITQAARGIGGRDLGRRLNAHRSDELGELASALNQMLDRVQTAFDAERHVASELPHELRTPIAIAQAKTSLALTQPANQDEYRKTLETVSRELSHLSGVTTRLLYLARYENGGGLVTAEVDVEDILTAVASDAEGLCENKGLGFHSNLSGLPGEYLMQGDGTRLTELFLNLIDNAIRYTPLGGKVSLSLGRQHGYAVIIVSDTGIGIADEHIPHLFERFYRAGESTAERGGTGLGLAICKRIVELHGGKIQVQSRVGDGSTFTVLLPLTEERNKS
jgi:signal transduction histidine kinase